MAVDRKTKEASPEAREEIKARVRKLRYATGDDREYAGPGTIQYFNRGGGKSETAGIDNPMSPNFVPLTNRSEMGKARFWAMQHKKSKNKQTSGVFDA